MHDIQEYYIYVVKPQFLVELRTELQDQGRLIGSLLFSKTRNARACFAQDIWLNPKIATISSISDAVNMLKTAGKFWYLHPLEHVRRSKLIEQSLRQYKGLNTTFPLESTIPEIGVFSLLDKNTLLYSTQRVRAWPDGECTFIEDKINPPNRAYLKLWEALTLLKRHPQKGDLALDLGASPGGWTYVMHSLGAHVTAVDKAPLAPSIAALPNVHCMQQSAFALEPMELEPIYEWVLSDIACYPERAYELIRKWIKSGKAKQLIVTIKLQGITDMQIIDLLKAIPNSYLTNLFHNKHEVTFFYPFLEQDQ